MTEEAIKVPMGGEVSSGSIPRVTQLRYPEGTPWWAKLAIQFILVVGFPGAICGFLLWERYTILRGFSETVQRIVPVLEKLERRLDQ